MSCVPCLTPSQSPFPGATAIAGHTAAAEGPVAPRASLLISLLSATEVGAQIPGLPPPKSTELLILVPLIMVVFSA